MDHPTFNGVPDYMNGFSIGDLAFSPNSTQFPNLINEYQFNQLSPDPNFMGSFCQNEANKAMQQNEQSVGTSNGKTRAKKNGDKKEVVDLRALLILCAQAVSADDRRTANELLKQIRQHSSPFGDGSQRLAHCFAYALEARLAGTGTQLYTALSSKRTLDADMLKAYQTYIKACPFMKAVIVIANHTISKLAEKAETLHIIDFGILYGFQWPALIHCLSRRPGGPPKLRITGIELPRSGFRPEERVQETGHRLAKYCERYNVPFEYNGIVKKWETIQYEELKVKRDEVLAVNNLFRFYNLLDETVTVNSPRDAVLNLIRGMNPEIFILSIINGSYNAPFFVTRFREALLHFSAFFDMCDTNLPREDPTRLMFEEEFLGREIVNTVACEGSERVVRPETYKQWQVRNTRAGFKQLPLDRELMNKLRSKVKLGYHRDFVVDEDGNWMLQWMEGQDYL
ncbi:scarecrow-like protein 14 [Pyrus x bretschneideri]|uniref:scarecrow-like protein 14 n=1 Tax=Pyrus x bretschneideri TaxID=225117 RepID=UPI002030C4E0|nr:scarecrow-like protein 14 [Pyrus x bretschneideri]